MKKSAVLTLLLLLTALACNLGQPEPTATPSPTDTPEPTTTPTLTPVPAPTETPTPTPTPGPLTPSEIFDHVSPSVAYVRLPNKSGSGILIEGGYIVTNAHVVWPYNEARIVFPDGSEFLDVPVLNLDLMADLAVLGPVEVEAEPQAMVDGEALVIGSDVYLIGYPGERDEFPTPTITRGLISRVREWEFLEITYFQTDAAIAGGQSGGVLVSEMGDVIGISGLSFTEAGFGVVASAGDIASRIEGLIAGEDVDGLGDRRIPTEGGRDHHTVILTDEHQTQVYILDEPVGTEVTIELFGNGRGGFRLYNPIGIPVLLADSEFTGRLRDSGEIELEGPYFLEIYQLDSERTTFTVASSHDLFPYENPEEDELSFVTSPYLLGVKTERQGSIDYPGDSDTFEIMLNAGEEVTIRVDSILMDPFIRVTFPGAEPDEIVSDNDSGGGIFSLSPELTYRAPHNADYIITVEDTGFGGQGGYVLTVEEPYEGAPTPVAIAPTPAPQDSPFGPMALFESEEYPFTMQYPADWNSSNSTAYEVFEFQCTFLECRHSLTGNSLVFLEIDLSAIDAEDYTLDEFLQLAIDNSETQGNTFISQEAFATEQGLNGAIVKSRNNLVDDFLLIEFVYIHDGILFNAVYAVVNDDVPELEETIRYTFGTFMVLDD